MTLTKKQKKYIRKNFRKKNVEQMTLELGISSSLIKDYLQSHHLNSQMADEKSLLKEKVLAFSLKHFFRENLLILIFLALCSFLVYANSLTNEFVSDDIAGILENPTLNNFFYNFSSPLRLLRFFQPTLYFFINLLFGKSPEAFRLTNVFFHTATVIAVYAVVYLLSNKITAVLAALILAVHPITTESVAWISGGGYVMYSFLLISAMFFYIFILRKDNYLYLALASFLLALTASEKAIIFPLILFLFAFSYQIKIKDWKKLIIISLPALIIGLIFLPKIPERISLLQTAYYQKGGLLNPLVQIPVAITSYLELIFWPKNLTLYHSEMVFTQGEYFLRLGGFILLLATIVFFFKKNRQIFFWLSFFVISLLPTLTPFGISWIVAERYVYLGSIGIFVIFALAIQKIGEVTKLKKIVYTLFAIILFTLAIRTITRNTDWKNQDTLWLATAKTSPSSAQNHNNLGDLYGRRGELEKSVSEFKKAIELNPGYADAYHNLANIYQQMGQTEEAIKNYETALSFNPNLWQSYQNLAAIYFGQDKFDLALKNLEGALKINPQNSNLYSNMGVIYLKMGDKNKAQEAFHRALQINPQDPRAKQLLLSF